MFIKLISQLRSPHFLKVLCESGYPGAPSNITEEVATTAVPPITGRVKLVLRNFCFQIFNFIGSLQVSSNLEYKHY